VAEIGALVAEYETSGLSRVNFCQSHGMSLATLSRYRKRQQRTQQEPIRTDRWVSVDVAGAPPAPMSGLALVLWRGRRIEVGRGFDAETLRRLVEVLEPR
jgi:hypothetical protein